MKILRALFLFASMIVLLTPAARAAADMSVADQTALDLIKNSPSLSIAAAAIDAAGLASMCSAQTLTLFVPNDDAFAALPRGKWAALMQPANADKLAKVVKSWMVDGSKRAADLHPGPMATLSGVALALDQKQNEWWFGGARVIQGDVVVKNGVMYITEGVTLPPGA